MPTMRTMWNWTRPELRLLAGSYLENDRSFVVRRCVQRFLAGEITAQEAIARSREHPDVRDDEGSPEAPSLP